MRFAGKKIVLLVIYLCFNAGLSYSMHFCGEVLQHFNFFAANETCCPEKGEMPDCCEDVSHLDVPNGEQFQPGTLSFSPTEFNRLPSLFHHGLNPVFFIAASTQKLGYVAHAPPILEAHLFILHQVFLI
jgi:hypothetical protein